MIDFENWIIDALKSHGGRASLIAVAKHIWDNHERELRSSGDLFYTWQYRIRWEATKLRKRGIMKSADEVEQKAWELN